MKKPIVLITFLLIASFFTGASYAATWYVATTGSDNNDGSINKPWQHIQYAERKAHGGDTVMIRAGTYPEEVWIQGRYGEGGSEATGYLTIQAYPGEEVILNNQNLTVEAGWVKVIGLHFIWPATLGAVDWWNKDNPSLPKGTKDPARNAADHVDFVNNRFTGPYNNYAGALNHMGTNSLIEGNILDLQYGSDGNRHGIYVLGGTDNIADNIIVRNNIIKHISGFGIHLYDERKQDCDAPKTISNITIENNYIEDCKYGGLIVATGSYTRWDGTTNCWQGGVNIKKVVVRNNTIVNTGNYAMSVNYAGDGIDNVSFLNNTIYNTANNTSYGGIWTRESIACTPSSNALCKPITNITFKNNIVHLNNTVGWHINNNANTQEVTASNNLFWPAPTRLRNITDSGLVLGDPLFVSIPDNNFHITSYSPAKDKGLLLQDVLTDGDGVSRPQGAGYDIGAYEYVSGVTYPKGDVNQDNSVDILDVQKLVNIILGQDTATSPADINQDSSIDVLDVQEVVNIILGG